MEPFSILASAAVILLKESFPHIRDLAGDAAVEALKTVAGEKGKEWAEAVGLLRSKVEDDKVAKTLSSLLQDAPDDEAVLESLRDRLHKLLEQDEVLRNELGARLEITEAGDGGLANAGELKAGQLATGGGNVQIHIGQLVVSVVHPTEGEPQPQLPPVDTHRDEYLRWVMRETADVRLSGVDPSIASNNQNPHLRLSGVYTALRTTTPRRVSEGLDEGSPKSRQQALHHQEEPPIPALEQLDSHPKLALLGQPGGGKSTFVNFVAHCLAGEALADPDANLKLMTAPLPEDDGSDGEASQPWKHTDLLPIRIILRDVAAKITKTEAEICADDLLGFLLDSLDAAALEPCKGPVEDALRSGQALVLLDGLDEVPEAQNRRQVICRLVESFVGSFSECRFVVTARTYAYQHQDFRLKGFKTVELAPFGNGQIRRFVRCWYEQVAEQGRLKENEAKGRAVLLERAIFSSDRLRDFAERPLLLTLMASLHAWRGGSLPRDRQKLYSDTVDLLLDTWEGQRRETDIEGKLVLDEPSLTEWLKIDRNEVLGILCELAFEAHKGQPETVGTADIPVGDLVPRLMDLRGKNAEDIHPKRLTTYLSQRAGILEERGNRIYTFPHRTFQEYLSARHLTDTGWSPDDIAGLGRKDPGRWREVILLAAAMHNAWSSLELADSLAFEGKDSNPKEVAWGLHLAGNTLVESPFLKEASERNRERLDKIRHRMVALLHSPHLPATERALAGDHLGKLGDPRFAEESPHLPVDEMAGFVLVPGRSYQMGETAYDDEKPEHSVNLSPYYMARYPVTTAQFRAFVDSGGKIGDQNALRDGANRPVIWVSWDEAMAYCAWLADRLRTMAPGLASSASSPEAVEMWRALTAGELRVQLPSEAQWEAAARGAEGRLYPWGDGAPSPEHANFSRSGFGRPSPVGIYAMGRGPFGTEDQAGNVLEWCLDAWDEEAYAKRDGAKDPLCRNENTEDRVCRGGSWWYGPGLLRAACRVRRRSRIRSGNLGFRVLLCRFPEP